MHSWRGTFNFKNHELRTIEIEGEPWFHATDACRCIGLSTKSGTHQHLVKLDKCEKQTLSKTTNRIGGVYEFLGGASMANIINEAGLNRLLMRADSAKARPFQDWLAKEVLPSIRKTGGGYDGNRAIPWVFNLAGLMEVETFSSRIEAM